MSLKNGSYKQNVNNLIEFLESNKDTLDRVDCEGTPIDSTSFDALEIVHDANQALSLESNSEIAVYLLMDFNKLLRIGYKKRKSCKGPMPVKFTLYPKADRLMLKTGRYGKNGKLVYIYYAEGSRIGDADEYIDFIYKTEFPEVAKLSDLIDPISIEQIRTRIEKASIFENFELLDDDIAEETQSSKKPVDPKIIATAIRVYLNGMNGRVVPMFPDHLEEAEPDVQTPEWPTFTLDSKDTLAAEEAVCVKLNALAGKGRVRLRHKEGE